MTATPDAATESLGQGGEPPALPPTPDAGAIGGTDWISQILVSVIASLVVAGVLLLGYHHLLARRAPRQGVLSLAEVLETKQLQLAIMASKPGTTAAQRNQATAEMGSFARDLEREISAIQRECECVMFVREAVVRAADSGVIDYTDELRRKVGLEGVTKEQLMSQVKALNQGIASFGGDPRTMPPGLHGAGRPVEGDTE